MFSPVSLAMAFLDWEFHMVWRGLLGHGQCAALGWGRHNPHRAASPQTWPLTEKEDGGHFISWCFCGARRTLNPGFSAF